VSYGGERATTQARQAWRALAERVPDVGLSFVEVVCSDPAEHRRRVEGRESDLEGLAMPRWQQVLAREYEPWKDERLVLDTADALVDAVETLEGYLAGSGN
jgi:hypothetical protein